MQQLNKEEVDGFFEFEHIRQQLEEYQEADKLKKNLDDADTAGFKITIDKELFSYQLTNKWYLAIAKPLLKRMEAPLKRVLRDAKLSLESVSDVILVGGNTKMPLVRQYLSYLLKHRLRTSINQDYAIALGCGVMAGIKERQADIKGHGSDRYLSIYPWY